MSFFHRNIVILCVLALILSVVILQQWAQIIFFIVVVGIMWKLAKQDRILVILQTLPRDVRYVYRMWCVMRSNHSMRKNNDTPASLLSARAAKDPDSPCFIFQGRVWTTREVDEYSWQVAHVFSELGLKHGDVVALMCTNCIEFVATWVGLSRLGVITALINTNLRHVALRHCLSVATPRAVIASSQLCSDVKEVSDVLGEDCKLIQICGEDQAEDHLEGFSVLNELLSTVSKTPIESLAPPSYHNKLLYIYTSGTTGLPKAALVKTSRYLFGAIAVKYLLCLESSDCVYNPLPLYHSSGGILGTGAALVYGIPSVFRQKFSASAYWKDCAENGCTVGQYIGEMCRYMLVQPPSDADQAHSVRLMVGNGLRLSIWKQFTKRFNIATIVELYGTTEGNVNIINLDGTVGAVGFIPCCLPQSIIPYGLVKIDPETKEFIRSDEDCLCIRCKPGEPGMLVGIIKEGDPTQDYHGYVNTKASTKNVAENVFSVGDKAFVTGDILVMDEKGYLYFKDRTGDTFRWKGENVSTCEVEAAVSSAVGLRDVCVYGVEIPENEGRAGMATIVDPNLDLNMEFLGKALAQALPSYAQPRFLRIAEKLEMTGTFKVKKNELLKQGYDPEQVQDKLYFRAGNSGEYEVLTKEVYDLIISGNIRV